jgi:hypothetical protein
MQVSRILIYYHIVILSSKDSILLYVLICAYSLFKLIILAEDFIEINSIVDHEYIYIYIYINFLLIN